MLISTIKKVLNRKELKFRTIKGAVWLGFGSSFEQGARFIRNMILARILAPEAFGLMAIVITVNQAFESFTQVGIKEAVVQSPNGEEFGYYNVAWLVSFARGILLFIIAIFCAPLVAGFYGYPELENMLYFSFIVVIFNGSISTRAYVILKQMNYPKWVAIFHGSAFLGVILAIVLSFIIRDVWALLIGFTAEAFLRFLFSFIFAPFLPSLTIDKESFRSLYKYMRGMFGLPILTFIFLNADVFVIAKMYPARELGFYSMALSLAMIPSILISMLINPLFMPAFSELQNNTKKLNQVVIKVTTFIAVTGTPVLFLLALYGYDIINIVYGSEYLVVSTPFAILFAATLIRTASSPIATVYFAIGRPELHRFFTGLRTVILLITIYPATKLFGLTGTALVILFSMIISYIFQVYRMSKLTQINILKYINSFVPGIFISIPLILVWFTTNKFFTSNAISHITPGIVGVLLAYFFLTIKLLYNRRALTR